MTKLFQLVSTLIVFFFLISCTDQPQVYDENIDAIKIVNKKLNNAKKEILLVFGANWCKDCIVFDELMSSRGVKSFIANQFDVIKIDVGSEGRNQMVVNKFGNPTNSGIPSIVIVNQDGSIKYATLSGELAKARDFTATDMRQFFEDIGYKQD